MRYVKIINYNIGKDEIAGYIAQDIKGKKILQKPAEGYDKLLEDAVKPALLSDSIENKGRIHETKEMIDIYHEKWLDIFLDHSDTLTVIEDGKISEEAFEKLKI